LSIVVYGREDCGYCKLAKQLLEQKEIPFEYVSLETAEQQADLLEFVSPLIRSVPVVVINGKWIPGGYEELAKIVREDEKFTTLRQIFDIDNLLRGDKPITVEFMKADGTIRVLKGTLHPDYLPVVDLSLGEIIKGTKAPKSLNARLVTVFDVEANDWRSFNIDTVISVTK
jgi:glutaredoxin